MAEQRAHNVHVQDGVSEDDFVQLRNARDKTLSMPTLMLPGVQVNVRAGHLPPPEDNGIRYLKIPLNALCALQFEAFSAWEIRARMGFKVAD